VIAQAPSFSLAGSADLETLAARIRELEPDIVLLEQRHGTDDPLDPLLSSGPAFVLLAHSEDAAAMAGGLRAGVRALVPHDATAHEIVAAIQAAAQGLIVLHPDMLASLQIAEPSRRPPADLDTFLTPREIEVLRMLAEGLANKNIAFRLGISEHTVKFHITSLFAKLNASSRAEAVAIGMRQGLILL
jgi:DNA-binding NarL/FixJ family response regulator